MYYYSAYARSSRTLVPRCCCDVFYWFQKKITSLLRPCRETATRDNYDNYRVLISVE